MENNEDNQELDTKELSEIDLTGEKTTESKRNDATEEMTSDEKAETDEEAIKDNEYVNDVKANPSQSEDYVEAESLIKENDFTELEGTAEENGLLETDDTIENHEGQNWVSVEKEDPLQGDTMKQPAPSSVAEIQSEADEADTEDMFKELAPGAQSSALIYRNIRPDIDLRYEVNSSSIKESIIVDAPCEEYVYGFRLLLDDLIPTIDDAGAIILTDNDGIVQYVIPAPYMIDANHDFSLDAHYSLELLEDNVWQLILQVDEQWMNDPNRAYPVIIDPTIVKRCETANGDISSTYVVQGEPTTAHSGYQQLYCGTTGYNNGKRQDVYLHVNVLPTIPPNCSVVSAAISYGQNGYSSGDPSAYTYIAAYELTDEKNRGNKSYVEWIHGLTWNTRPSDSGKVLDYVKLNNSTAGYYQSWDVTAAAVKWYENTSNNHGIVLRRWETDTLNKSVLLMSYGSSTPSYFAVNYRNLVGIEGYYSCQTQAADRAGVTYIGDYSGNLTVITPLVSFDSVINGYGLNLVYNSANAIYSYTHNEGAGIHAQGYGGLTGAGWKLSAQETLRELSLTDYNNTTTEYIVFNDSDGTEHYFRKESDGKYLDEDGLNLQITKSGNEYTMIERPASSGSNTSSKAKKVFWRGYLTEIHDNNDNAIYFLYNNHEYVSGSNYWKPDGTTGQKLTKIIQMNHGGSQIEIVSLVYDSSNYLTRVKDYSDRVTSFSYSTVSGVKYLTTITWPDSKTASYFYDSTHRRMSQLRDNESGYGLNLTYRYFRHARVVNQVTENTTVSGTTNTGNSWHAYHHSQRLMEYRFYGADHTADTADDIVTRYSFDFSGRTINATNLDTAKADVLGVSTSSFTKNANTSAQNNRMTGASASGMAAVNLLKNSGAEKSSTNSSGAAYWTATHPNDTTLGNATVGGAYDRNNCSVSPRTGSTLFKTYIKTTGCSKIYQTVYLQKDKTYTLSAYINTAGNTPENFGNGGAFIAFSKGNAIDIEKKSTYVNYPTSNSIDGGWERVSVTYTPRDSGKYTVIMGVENCSSVVVSYDDLQLEIGEAASTANLIQYGSFETVNDSGTKTTDGAKDFWKIDKDTGFATSAHHGNYSICITGDVKNMKRAHQTVNINADIHSTWILSGWAKADSVANTQPDPDDSNAPNKRFFGLIAEINYNKGASEMHYVPFNDDFTGWQYVSGMIVPKSTDQSKTVTSITVYTAYDYNCNTAWFDEISLRPEPVETYKYDSKGNLTAVNSTDNNSDSYTYNGPDLSQAKTGVTGTFNYTYDSNHNMTKATTNSNNTMDVTYDSMGSAKTTKWYVTSQSKAWYLQTGTNYSEDGNRVTSKTDANNITTRYEYYGSGSPAGANGQLRSTTVGDTATTVLKYAPANERQTQIYQNGIISASFLYNSQGFINSIARKTFPRSSYSADPNTSEAQWQSYKFTTDSFGNPTDIYVSPTDNSTSVIMSNDIQLAHYDYETYVSGVSGIKNGRLERMTYGNGAYVDYCYNRFDEVVQQDYSDGDSDRFFYNAEGLLTKKARIHGTTVDGVYSFEYDSLGRLIRSRQSGNGVIYNDETISEGVMVQRTEHLYDAENRVTKQAAVLGDRTYTSTYAYNDDVASNTSGIKDGSLKQVGFTELNKTLSYTYDSLKHLQAAAVNGVYRRSYEYRGAGGQRSTNQISKISYTANSSGLDALSYSYSYDNRGNVTQVKQNGSTVAEYTYNPQNQMISETRGGNTYTFTYDTAGNILSKEVAGVPGTAKTYSYGNFRWNDLLTAYDGIPIYYEGQNNGLSAMPTSGNPTNWYNGSSYTNLTWRKGRQLSSLTKDGTSISYAYDMDGIRSSKTVGGETHTYLTQSGKVVRETIGTGSSAVILDFVYDNNGQPFAMCYSNNNGASFVTFYYILNLQGDVVRLVNAYGQIKASYEYDAWGSVLSQQSYDDNFPYLDRVNPLRYRGYYYDKETGWYYLQSRYYDPEVGRFINADLPEYAANFSIDDNNLFAYCANNPVTRIDPKGEFFNTIVGAIGGAIGGYIGALVNGDDPVAGAKIGALTGAVAGLAVDIAIATGGVGGVVIAAAGGFIAGGADSILNDKANHREIDYGSAALSASIGAVANVLSFGTVDTKGLKQGGKAIKNFFQNGWKQLTANTTRKVAGHTMRKTVRGIIKNVGKNIFNGGVSSGIIATGANLFKRKVTGLWK